MAKLVSFERRDMTKWMRAAAIAAAGIAALLTAPAWALTADEEAAVAVGQQWVKAVTARDIEAQVKLMPATMFPREGDRDRARKLKAHDNELALIRKQKYSMFEVAPPMQTLKVGAATLVVLPYKSAVDSSLEGRMQVESSLIALTLDGRNWSVFDGSGQNLKSLKVIVPGYAGGLNVPPVRSVVTKPE